MKPLTFWTNRIGTRSLVAVHDEPGGLVGGIDVDHAAELERARRRASRASSGWRRRRPARRRAGRSRRRASGRTRPCTRRTGRHRGGVSSRSRTSYSGWVNVVECSGGCGGWTLSPGADPGYPAAAHPTSRRRRSRHASSFGFAVVDGAADRGVHLRAAERLRDRRPGRSRPSRAPGRRGTARCPRS